MSWPQRPLEEVADFCLGKMLDQKKNRGELMPYLANVNVRWGEFDFENLREMKFEQGELERYGLKPGDIVMCEGGEPGRCAIWKDQVPGMMLQKALHRIRPHECLDSRFLYYSFLKKGKNNELSGYFTGSTIKHLPREKLALVKVEIPPLVAQQKIADILSAYDNLIETNRRRIALLEEAARLLYREWFVHFRFPGHEHAPLTDGLPEGWERRKLGEVSDVRLGKMLDEKKNRGELRPYLANVNVRWGKFDLHDLREMRFGPHEVEKYGLMPGDIVMCEGGEPGRCAIWKDQVPGMMLQKALHRIRPCQGLDHHFLYHCLLFMAKSGRLAGLFTGATIKHLPREKLVTVAIVIPPKRIVREFADQAAPIDAQIGTLEAANRRAAEARDLLLPRLMNGEIAV
ncbi:restriction endonuclease subunit S [Thalassobaculum litoreum]|uniref:Type I restriction enzyme, S subunit n=1 Tax=Thalassobaculum litoreum DSM 18839 TaxID=1123362 RepID=A0A8G2BE91_9PROT|nr:restriction endonuclease subunit S [Thalassobaculum litoreum]SDF12538.1 type I restriction enzyme, S subunit [Thalassobaculum litoreum DSM 18839]